MGLLMETILLLLVISVAIQSVCAIDCGFPGLPISGEVDVATDWKNNSIAYPAGIELTYFCENDFESLKGSRKRTCQQNGVWSGYRPFCEPNVAFKKNVTYVGARKHRHHHHGDARLLTDGYTDPEDQECFKMASGSVGESVFVLDLGQRMAVHSVYIHLRDDDEGRHLLGDKLTLEDADVPLECQRQAESPLPDVAIYRCLDINEGVDVLSNKGRTLRLQHKNSHSVDICEVQVFANPLKFDCGLPEVPANGRVEIVRKVYDYQTFYELAQYECNEDYQLQGTDRRVCHGRHWQQTSPTCVPVTVSPGEKQLTNDIEVDLASSEESAEDIKIELPEAPSETFYQVPPIRVISESMASGETVHVRVHILRIVLFVLSGLLLVLGLVLATLFFLYRKRTRCEVYHTVAVEHERAVDEEEANAKDTHPLKMAVYVSSTDPDPSGYISRAIKKAYQSIRNV